MIAHFSKLLHETWFGWALGGGIPWLLPLFAALHLAGMALLVGYVALYDLRLLGVAKGVPVSALQQLMPVAIAGLLINAITGLGFYAGTPDRYQSEAFAAKMGFLVLAGANAVLFTVTGLSRRVALIDAGEDVPAGAKILAITSLILWFGVMFWGRMLPVFGNTS